MNQPDEIGTDVAQVRRLVASQFPELAGRPVTEVGRRGTDHTLYRVGDDLVARLPRIPAAVAQVESDRRWLTRIAPHLPLPVPAPIAVGEPGEGYPWPWTVVPWLAGTNPDPADDLTTLAVDLAGFVTAMGRVEPYDGRVSSGVTRGAPLANRAELTRGALAELGDRVDRRALTAAWDEALEADPWAGPPVWVHGDLLAGNLLVEGDRLSAVIDFGALGRADPAIELLPAWHLFGARARGAYRQALGVDEATWVRGWGWALSISLHGLAHFWDRRPDWRANDLRVLDLVLAARAGRRA
jgi:aminoglycoside phosphotransferase (APT) family kinase protein